jgi:uncharacterized protein
VDSESKRQLLDLARRTVQAVARGDPLPSSEGVAGSDEPYSGVFVTLRKGGQLRGCIGTFSPAGTLPNAVVEYAVHSALHDTRFPPVAPAEVTDLNLEISVLSPLTPTDDPGSLEVGRHGVYLRTKGEAVPRTACFLPQVATEQRWDAEQFLSALCAHKCCPPLDADAWQDPTRVEISLFTAEVFSEADG